MAPLGVGAGVSSGGASIKKVSKMEAERNCARAPRLISIDPKISACRLTGLTERWTYSHRSPHPWLEWPSHHCIVSLVRNGSSADLLSQSTLGIYRAPCRCKLLPGTSVNTTSYIV